MPTVVAKGEMCLKLDFRYSTPYDRWDSLKNLRAAAKSLSEQGKATSGFSNTNADHLNQHWFGGNNWWHVMDWAGGLFLIDPRLGKVSPTGKMSEAAAARGEQIIRRGLIEALEISLGLKHDQVPATEQRFVLGRTDPSLPGTNFTEAIGNIVAGARWVDWPLTSRDIPVEVFWVCGKLDGFEVDITWDPSQVSCHLVTPPVAFAYYKTLAKYRFSGAELETAKQGHERGMVKVGAGEGADAGQITAELVAYQSNGVTWKNVQEPANTFHLSEAAMRAKVLGF